MKTVNIRVTANNVYLVNVSDQTGSTWQEDDYAFARLSQVVKFVKDVYAPPAVEEAVVAEEQV